MNNSTDQPEAELIKSINKLVVTLNAYNYSLKKRLWQSILTGAMSALGGVLALAILLPLLVFILSQFEWIPAIGDFAKKVVDHIQNAK